MAAFIISYMKQEDITDAFSQRMVTQTIPIRELVSATR